MNVTQTQPDESPLPAPDFASVFECLPIALLMILPDDPVFTVISANKAFVKLTGIEKSELVGRGLFAAFQGNDADRDGAGNLIEAYKDAIDNKIMVRISDFRFDFGGLSSGTFSQEARYWRGGVTPIVDARGQVPYLLQSWESTGGAGVKRELQESDQRYRFLADTIPQMVWTATPDGGLDYVSVQVTAYFGATTDAVLGAGWLKWVHPDDQDAAVERWKHSLTSGEPYETSFRLLRAEDNVWHWHLVRAQPIYGPGKRIVQWVGTCTDIEDQKRAEVALTEKARLSALGSDIGATLTQGAELQVSLQRCAHLIVEHLEGAFARIWTLSPKEDVLELQASAGIYTHLDGTHARVPVGSFKIGLIALERKPHLTNDVVNDPRVSDQAWAKREGMIAFAGYPLVVNEKLIGVVALFARHLLGTDSLAALGSVSATIAIAIERKRGEEELSWRAAELKRSNEDLEQFANVASHDLRSPLNTISQFTGLITRRFGSGLGPEVKQMLQIVQDSSRRMGDLVSALLSYSRLSDPTSSVLRRVSSLTAYEDAVANLRSAIDDAKAHIEREELPEVLSSPEQLSQVFQNIISNAIHYRGEVPPHIRVSAERRNAFWLFSITDNGPGIATQYHNLIFEPFKRLHGIERPGSGIGLAFCRKFIEREGGQIWVESEEGKGASFRFTLPAVEDNKSVAV